MKRITHNFNEKRTFSKGRPFERSSEVEPWRRRPDVTAVFRRQLPIIENQRLDKNLEFSKEQSTIASDFLLHEKSGFLEADADDVVETFKVTQEEIRGAVDISSAAKSFDLSLSEYGPYRSAYTRNGRHLLLGGRKGHVACLNWATKSLNCEINVMEDVYDVSFLHQETMFAVAQKDWVHIYDNQGIELHCIKKLDRVLRLEFLPYHFLLVTTNERSFISWLDVSIGQMVAQTHSKLGRLNVMCTNPYNGVVLLGTAKGTVSMWSPTVKTPLASILCHRRPVTAVAVDDTGNYMATAATDGAIKIWDVRKFDFLKAYHLEGGITNMSFSQRGLLGVSIGHVVQVFKDCTKGFETPYIRQRVGRTVTDVAFCPYEDVLGIGHDGGFTSILVPGAGEPNFDALESNPYETKTQRQEGEVKSLLEKINHELICLDPTIVNKVPKIPDPIDLGIESEKVPKVTYVQHKKVKNAGVKGAQRKQSIRNKLTREVVRNVIDKKTVGNKSDKKPKHLEKSNEQKKTREVERYDVFKRFKNNN